MTDTVPTRSIDLTTEIAAPADAVWAALTQADQIACWFSPTAEGEGDTVRFSWGPDMSWEEHLVEVEPGRHLCWGESPDAPTVIDWHIETKGGHTVVRLVQSGLKAGAQWDDAYEATQAGWRYFLFNLKHYLTRHRGTPRATAWTRHPTQAPRATVWERLTATLIPRDGQMQIDGVTQRAIVQEVKANHLLSATLPELNDALIFVELEGKTLGVYVSTYGLPADRVSSLQRWVDGLSHVAN